MKLQGISKEGLKRIASKVAQAGDSRVIDGVQFQWDTESNPDDPGWVYLDAQGYPQAVPGLEGRDPQATDEELALAAFGTTASKRPRRAQDSNPVKEYWGTVKAIAQEIKDEYKQYGDIDVEQMIAEQVDGSEYIIYYAKNLEVLQNSDNADAIDEVGAEIDTSKGWQNILTQVAYYAMEADVRDALANIGYGTAAWEGGFDDEEEDF